MIPTNLLKWIGSCMLLLTISPLWCYCPWICKCSVDLKVVNCTNPDLMVTPEGRVLPVVRKKPDSLESVAVILTKIPAGLPIHMETLIMSHNDLSDIDAHVFLQLSRLKNLHLDNCNIRNYGLGFDSFRGLLNLEKLVLSNNSIAWIPATICSDMPNLIEMHLDGNNLVSFPDLRQCKELRELTLSRNEMVCESTYQVWMKRYKINLNGYTLSHSAEEYKWLDGFCMNRRFRYIPPLDTVHKLDLSAIGLEVLLNLTFAHLPQVRSLSLAHNRLQTIDNFAFEGLAELDKLDLSYNMIKMLQALAFWSLSRLTEMSLRGNRLTTLDNALLFKYLTNLRKLDLSQNRISAIGPSVFGKLNSLRFLNLSYNDLSNAMKFDNGDILSALVDLRFLDIRSNELVRIRIASLDPLIQLRRLDVRDNPFRSDGHLIWFGYWCKNSTHVTVLNWKEIRWRDGYLIDQPLNEPWKDYPGFLLYFETETLGILVILTIFFYTIFLLALCLGWRMRFISRFVDTDYWGITLCWTVYKAREKTRCNDREQAVAGVTYEYDVYVSSAEKDRDFVENRLLQLDEENEGPYQMCYGPRDFRMGKLLFDSMSDSMTVSKRAVIVLTDSYIDSYFCKLELYDLLYRRKENNSFPLVFVTYENKLDMTRIPRWLHFPLISNSLVSFTGTEGSEMDTLRRRLADPPVRQDLLRITASQPE